MIRDLATVIAQTLTVMLAAWMAGALLGLVALGFRMVSGG